MAGIVDMLAQPIHGLLQSFGNGQLAGAPTAALQQSSQAIDAAHQAHRAGIDTLGDAWHGQTSEAAMNQTAAVQRSAVEISDRGTDIAQVLTAASADLSAGAKQLDGVLTSFTTKADALGPALTTVPGLVAVVGLAQAHLAQALGVVAETQGKLTGHTGKMTTLAPPADQVPAPVAVAPGASSVVSSAAAAAGPELSKAGDVLKTVTSGASQVGQSILGAFTGNANQVSSAMAGNGAHQGAVAGQGVRLTLPDGSTVVAPNEKAATAVRAALTQRGVPYVWGGTSPGQGLDCSGLTQYAYRQAGVDLPRLAQEQGSGHERVAANEVAPGDLAVWSGHVAMVIGNGQMVEAGDPVQVSHIRTENEGMEFQGFYRPTS